MLVELNEDEESLEDILKERLLLFLLSFIFRFNFNFVRNLHASKEKLIVHYYFIF